MSRCATDDDALLAIELIAGEAITIAGAARRIGCDRSSLNKMLNSPAYIALAAEADMLAADTHIDLAMQALDEIPDDAERGCIARQIAKDQQHRKLASFRNRKRYGEQVQVEHTHQVSLSGVLEDVRARANALRGESDITDCAIIERSEAVDKLDHMELSTNYIEPE